MSGIGWHISVFGAIIIFLIMLTCRTVIAIRLRIHMKQILSPMPNANNKNQNVSSNHETFKWWRKPQNWLRIGLVVYITKEILQLRGVYHYHRAFRPLTFAFYAGIYLIAGMLLFSLVSAVFIITETPLPVLNVFLGIVSVLAFMGYLLGSLGTIGQIIKHGLYSSLRPFNIASTYFSLLFLGIVFFSGFYVWFLGEDFAFIISLFISKLITLDPDITAAFPLSMHIMIAIFFILYLSLLNMTPLFTRPTAPRKPQATKQ
jgi:hypothetical protein